MSSANQLDNPVYFSLAESHRVFTQEYPGAKFYRPEYCPFGAYYGRPNDDRALKSYSELIDEFYVVGEKPPHCPGLELIRELVCCQMVLSRPIAFEPTEHIVKLESEYQKEQLFHLVNRVQPGYFRSKTAELGNYYGIYQDDVLIAVTGERMKMEVYTEISAVVTHPEFTGRGFAKQLTALTANRIFEAGKTPYLHVAEFNTTAIGLYQKLGFTERRKMSFWQLKKVNTMVK